MYNQVVTERKRRISRKPKAEADTPGGRRIRQIAKEIIETFGDICPQQIELHDQMIAITRRRPGRSDETANVKANSIAREAKEAEECWENKRIWLARLGNNRTREMSLRATSCNCDCPADIESICGLSQVRPLMVRRSDEVNPVLTGLFFGAQASEVDMGEETGMMIRRYPAEMTAGKSRDMAFPIPLLSGKALTEEGIDGLTEAVFPDFFKKVIKGGDNK